MKNKNIKSPNPLFKGGYNEKQKYKIPQTPFLKGAIMKNKNTKSPKPPF